MASLRVDHDGYLMVDFRWQGVRCREYLGRKDTKENRGDARRLVRRIDGEIAGGTFDYLKYFPDGRKKHLFARETAETGVVPPFGAFAREWLRNKKAWFSPGTFYDRERIIEGKLIPFLEQRADQIRNRDVPAARVGHHA